MWKSIFFLVPEESSVTSNMPRFVRHPVFSRCINIQAVANSLKTAWTSFFRDCFSSAKAYSQFVFFTKFAISALLILPFFIVPLKLYLALKGLSSMIYSPILASRFSHTVKGQRYNTRFLKGLLGTSRVNQTRNIVDSLTMSCWPMVMENVP